MSSSLLATTVCQTLIAQGVRHVLLSPGSRNAPLSLALASAARDGLIELNVRLDERTAGFIALGIAKATGRPVAVVTTSGTAVANLHPAVLEARHSGVPLLVLSADRPLSARRSGSNQTTEQDAFFGSGALDASLISSQSGGPDDWRFAVRRALALATGVRTRQPGPVQLNLALAEPLIEDSLLGSCLAVDPSDELFIDAARPATAHPVSPAPGTVVIVGDADPATGGAARSFAEQAQLPLLAEPSSNARSGPCAIADYVSLLKGPLAHRIERALVFGHPTLSRPVAALLRRADVEVIIVAEHAQWNDQGHRASRIVDQVRATGAADPAWLAEWQAADAVADDAGWSRIGIAADVLGALGADDILLAGSSQVIRDLDAAPICAHPATVLANRGLAGIDGTLSTALGVALGSGHPTTALLGDLATLHDLGAFVRGDLEPEVGVRVVLVDDHGGGIFATLEQGAPAFAEHFARVFATPQHVDLPTVLRALGADVVQVSDRRALREALGSPAPANRWQVIIASVDPVRARD